MGKVLSSGSARHHRASPAASIRAEKLYGLPVLMSGLASLTLSCTEIKTLSLHYKTTLEGLLKIHQKTPESFIFFITGSLPFPAQLHLKQLCLFGMICRQEENILQRVARYVLTCCLDNSSSWFSQIRNICSKYRLPHPLTLLDSPPSKEEFKRIVREKVLDYWTKELRADAAKLDSLEYFKPEFMSLDAPHPILTTCGSNPYEINKSICQLKFLSGR